MNGNETKIKRLILRSKEERPRFISLLQDEISKERLSVFVGAGCSMALGLPSWDGLINELLDKYNIKSNEQNLFRRCSRIERAVGPLKFREEIVERLRLDTISKSPLHDALFDLEVNLFITTNYDSILEDYFKINEVSPVIISDQESIPSIDLTRKTIVKLHGDLNSPTSLIITQNDYTKYKSENKGFVDWLKAIATMKNILFVGTSFDDPRLKDMDDYILNIFGTNRRQLFLFLRIPSQSKDKSDEDFSIQLDDFEVICDDFHDRGIYLILVTNYEDITDILKSLNEKVLAEKIKANPDDIRLLLKMEEDYSYHLEESLRKLIDTKIQDWKKKILGDGRLPGKAKIKENLNKLLEFLENPPPTLSPESNIEGFLVASRACLVIANSKNDILTARKLYTKAKEFNLKSKSGPKFEDQLKKQNARLLFQEGHIDEAIDLMSNSDNSEYISFLLLFLLEVKRVDEAFEFIEKNGIKTQWASEALRIYISKGKIADAESLFRKTLKEFEEQEARGNLEKTEYKGDHFFDRLCYTMIDEIYQNAVEYAGINDFNDSPPSEVNQKSRDLLGKALEFVDLFYKKRITLSPGDSYLLSNILYFELNICRLLAKHDRADDVARKICSSGNITEGVVTYILDRGEEFQDSNSTLRKMPEKLAEEYPERSWSYLYIADIQARLKNNEGSWEALKRSIAISAGEENKFGFSQILNALNVGGKIGKITETYWDLQKNMDFNEEESIFWEAVYKGYSGKIDDATELFEKVDAGNISMPMKALSRSMRAAKEIETQNFEEARHLLEESNKLDPNPTTLLNLLFVLVELGDVVEILKLAEKIESYGNKNDQVVSVKAQAAQTLRQFEKSEAAWKKLQQKYPDNPQYTFELARVMTLRDKEADAQKVLERFIKPDEMLDLNCLRLSLDVHSFLKENEKAFSLLEELWTQIKDQPDLLSKHMQFAFQIGRDEDAEKSMTRLQQLQEEGKVKDMFIPVSDDATELIDMIKKSRQRGEEISDSYMRGQIPRMLYCGSMGRSLYLDWAIRTQTFSGFSNIDRKWDFNVYATNCFRIDRVDKVHQLVQIEVPDGIKEVVIDYHALLTIHRLGFLPIMGRRFNTIYYPEVFKRLWKMEQNQYTTSQLSKVKTNKRIEERFHRNEIKIAIAEKKDLLTGRDLSLAQLEQVPLISNYIKEEEFTEYPGVLVIRLPQLIDWIYEKGRISEAHWQKMLKGAKGELPSKNDEWKLTLNSVRQCVVESVTLDVMEALGVIDKLVEIGVELLVEKYTADKLRQEIVNYEFGEKVAKWHKQLIDEISGNSKFIKAKPDYGNDEVNNLLKNDLHLEGLYAPSRFAEQKELQLLTDDRVMQRAPNSSFGTDALLKDLFERGIINIEEYADSFLKLCNWRYRFLLPDTRVLLYLAKQYKQNLPGKGLIDIAQYLKHNLEDPALPVNFEPTRPPNSVAFNYFMKVIDTWLDFLSQIWQDDETFNEENLYQVTDWFYRYAMPDIPCFFTSKMKTLISSRRGVTFSSKLFAFVFQAEHHHKLHKFLKRSFEYLFDNPDKEKEALLNVVNYQLNFEFPVPPELHEDDPQKILRRYSLRKILEVYYGKELKKISGDIAKFPELMTALYDILPVDIGIDPVETDRITKALSDRKQIGDFHQNERIVGITPTIITYKTPTGETGSPLHNLITHPAVGIKNNTLERILESTFITDYTKEKIATLKDQVLSSTGKYLHSASENIEKLLLKDYRYGQQLFKDLKVKPITKFPLSFFEPIEKPDLLTVTVTDQLPFLLRGNLDPQQIANQINNKINESSDFKRFLDFLLQDYYFVPLGAPLNPWNFVEKFIVKADILFGDALNLLKEWINKNHDPLGYLMALEILLNLRARVESKDDNEFKGKSFIDFHNKIFTVLLMSDENDGLIDKDKEELKNPVLPKGSIDDEGFNNIKSRWLFRKELSRYYLRYIDLNLTQPGDDEFKVVLAWWMAREFEEILGKGLLDTALSGHTYRLDKKAKEINGERTIYLQHENMRVSKSSVARFYTIGNRLTLLSLTLSALYPSEASQGALMGLKKPTTILNPMLRDIIINSTVQGTLHGEDQILKAKKGSLPYYWDYPVCYTVPKFIREYYGDAFKFLGEEKVQLIEFADEFMKLSNLQVYLPLLKKGAGIEIWRTFLILSSCESYITLHGTMPDGAEVFEEVGLIEQIVMENGTMASLSAHCLQKVYSILDKLISAGNYQWANIFQNQLKALSYEQLIEHSEAVEIIIESLENHIVMVAIKGYDLSVLEPVLKLRHKNKRIRGMFGKLKHNLERHIRYIPIENRENLRIFLNSIADIPTIGENELTKLGG